MYSLASFAKLVKPSIGVGILSGRCLTVDDQGETVSRDASEVRYAGEWWLPSTPESRTRGTLVVSTEGGAGLSLELGGSLGPRPGAGGPVAKAFCVELHITYAVILGEAREIGEEKQECQTRRLTLGNCYVEPKLSPSDRLDSYSVGVVVLGDVHVPSLSFDELAFDVPNLANAFPGESIFGHSHSGDSAPVSTDTSVFAMHRVVQRWFVNSGYGAKLSRHADTEIRFVHDIETDHEGSNATSLVEKYRVIVRFRFRKERWTIQNAEWFWRDFSQFFSIMTGLRLRSNHIAGTVHNGSKTAILDIQPAYMYDGSPFLREVSNDPARNRYPLFNVSELASRNIGSFWLNWFWAELGLSETQLLRGISQQLFERRCLDESMLLSIAALESLHDVWVPYVEPGEGARNKNSSTGNQALPVYVSGLAQHYVPGLKTHAADLSLAVSDCRNYAAHHGVEAAKNHDRWPSGLVEVVPQFCEFLLDMTILDMAESHSHPRSYRSMAKKYADHWEHARLVDYIVAELDRVPAMQSEKG
jgi:hypothetical protein